MLLTPLHPGPDHPYYWTFSISYYTDWKIFDYPAISFPSTVVDHLKYCVEEKK